MKKFILAILLAICLSSTAIALPCLEDNQCQIQGAGFEKFCFWRDAARGGQASPTTCCRDYPDCNILCTAPTTGASVATDNSGTVTLGTNPASFHVDLGGFSGDSENFHVYVKVPAGFPRDGNSILVDGQDTSGTQTQDGGLIVDIADKIPGYGSAPGGFTGGSNPPSVTVAIPTADAGQGGTFLVTVGTSGGIGSSSNVPISLWLNITGIKPSYKLYSDKTAVEADTPVTPTQQSQAGFNVNDKFYIQAGTVPYSYLRFDMSQGYQWAAYWDLTTGGSNGLDILVSDDKGGWIAADDGDFPLLLGLWPTGLLKDVLIPAGDVPYGYCCPSDVSLQGVNPSCTNMFKTTTTEVIDGTTYYVCAGMTNSGGATNGETNLTINDSAEGSTVATGVSVNFFAYFYNKTNGYGDTTLNSTNANCTVYEDGGNQTMTYDGTDKRWEYTDASGYSSSGTKNWEVWCDTNATGHFDLYASDDIDVENPAPSYPEFSDFAWILAAVLGAGGFILVRRKMNPSF